MRQRDFVLNLASEISGGSKYNPRYSETRDMFSEFMDDVGPSK